MSTRSNTNSGPKILSLSGSLCYLTAAVIINLLYYLNPGLWALLDNTLKWLAWVKTL